MRSSALMGGPGSGAAAVLPDFAGVCAGGAGSEPPIDTGVAAPRLVAGAIAAKWQAYRMYVPALAARAPGGAT